MLVKWMPPARMRLNVTLHPYGVTRGVMANAATVRVASRTARIVRNIMPPACLPGGGVHIGVGSRSAYTAGVGEGSGLPLRCRPRVVELATDVQRWQPTRRLTTEI